MSKENSRPISVAQICLTHAWGGMEMSCVEYANMFAQMGHHSVAICLQGSSVEENLRLPKENILTVQRSGYFAPAQSYAMRQFFETHNVQVLLVHLLKDLWFLYPATLGLGIKTFGFAHMFLRNISKKDFLHSVVYSQLQELFALSQTQRRHLLECLPLAPEKVTILPNGVDLQRFGAHRRSSELRQKFFGAGPNETVVGVVGRLDPQKGQLEFLEAAAQVAQDFPKVQFAFVGQENKDGIAYRRALEQRVRDLNLQKRVHFAGHHADVTDFMASLDVFVLPSYEEAFGKVTIEAMACQLPIVGTRSGSTPEILAEGKCGVLVEPRDAHDLARGLRKILSEPDHAQELARSARARVETSYDLEHIKQDLFKRIGLDL